MVIEPIEAHLDEDEGHLRLDCADEEFARIRDLIIAGAPSSEGLELFRDGIRSIVVCRRPSPDEGPPRRPARGFRLALIALALAASLAIQVIGIIAIVRWLRVFGS